MKERTAGQIEQVAEPGALDALQDLSSILGSAPNLFVGTPEAEAVGCFALVGYETDNGSGVLA
jgi:hypothetical protein